MQTFVRLPLVALCGVAGFLAARPFVSLPPAPNLAGSPSAASVVVDQLRPATGAESTLIAEWDQLRATRTNSPDELPALYADVKGIADSFRRRAFRSAIIAEWAVTNPQAALAYLGGKDKGMVTQLIREWLRIDPNAAVTALLAGGEKQSGNLRSVLTDIARLAPDRLAQVLSALPKSQSRWDSTGLDAFAQYAVQDPEAARKAAESVTGPLRGQALAGVARAWAEKDGEAALRWAQAIPAGEEQDAALKAVLSGWAKTDPVAALNRIDLAPPGGEEGHYASDVGAQVLREAGKKDWDATVKWLRDNPGTLGLSSLEGLQDAVSHRLSTDPAGTLRAISTAGVPGIDNVLANSLLNDGYSQRDQVWQWLELQPSNDFTQSVRGAVINAIAWKEPALALTYLDRLPDTVENRSVLERGVGSLLNGGSQMHLFEEFMEAASPKVRPFLLAAGFEYGLRESVTEPERWIKRIDELPPERRASATEAVVRGWAQSDPEAALQWVSTLADNAQRDAAYGPISSAWASSDPHAAAAWIDGMPAGTTRDTATRGFVSALCESQPETAWTWAMSIVGEQARFSALQLAYMGLQRRNPEAAQQVLDTANLPPEQIEGLRKIKMP